MAGSGVRLVDCVTPSETRSGAVREEIAAAPESGIIRLVMTAPPIVDGGWFQVLAITNRGCKSSIRKPMTGLRYGGTRL